ncbi:arginase [Candidatus Saccharibacteria bacterium]|nr:arginase [Candidatus Saccharibacteria bacterium]
MLKIISAPTSLGSSSPGAEKAPAVILGTSLRDGLTHNHIEFLELQPVEERKLKDSSRLKNYSSVIDFNKRLYKQAVGEVGSKDTMLTIGGDHSVSYGSFFASKQLWPKGCIVYIDAHPDCLGPDTTQSRNLHGLQLATAMGDSLYSDFKLKKFGYDEVFLIGIKDIDPPEQEYLDTKKITYFTMDDVISLGIAEVMAKVLHTIGDRPVHVSLDIDGIDVAEAPGTGIINTGGLSYREASYICRYLAKHKIRAIDLVEVNPDRDVNNKTVQLGSELVVALLGGQWTAYNQYMALESKLQA